MGSKKKTATPKTDRSTATRQARLSTYHAVEPRRQRFVAEYLVDLNGARAAKAAGYTPRAARQGAYWLLKDPRIRALLAEEEKKLLAKSELSAQNVLETIRQHVMRDVAGFIRPDGSLKSLHELTPSQLRVIDKIVKQVDGGESTYVIDGLIRWTEMAAKHFSLLTERVEVVDGRHIEDKLNEVRDRAVKAGHAWTKPDVGKKGMK